LVTPLRFKKVQKVQKVQRLKKVSENVVMVLHACSKMVTLPEEVVIFFEPFEPFKTSA